MSDNHHLVGLDDFFLEEVHKLQLLLVSNLYHGIEEDVVVCLWQFDAREQVRDDAIEQRNVMGQELWQIHINDGSEQL